jgi:hypothetical protein
MQDASRREHPPRYQHPRYDNSISVKLGRETDERLRPLTAPAQLLYFLLAGNPVERLAWDPTGALLVTAKGRTVGGLVAAMCDLIDHGAARIEEDGSVTLLWNDIIRPCYMPRRRRHAIPLDVRRAVLERDGHACVYCGATDKLCMDHIYPWSRGGSDEPDNLQTLCRSCNGTKGAKI